MTSLDLAGRRLTNQHLAANPFEKPEEVVQWFGAVQSQDYGGAKWAIAQRTNVVNSAVLDQLFAAGAILRTHVLRPTWHFVLPSDIRWLLKLTGPRVHAINAYYYRQSELDEAVFKRSHAALTKALQGGKHLTRPELAQVLAENGLVPSGLRLAYLLMNAELDGLICSGPLRGKQFTYVLLEERVTPTKTLTQDEALAELTRRYFTSHGPATLPDYSWWSGLSMAEVKAGLELVKSELECEIIGDKTYWFAAATTSVKIKTPTVHLLPNYDEHVVAYKDHRASFDSAVYNNLDPTNAALLAHIIILNGLVIGGWRRTIQKKEITITPNLIVSLNESEQAALKSAVEAYGQFMGLPVTLATDS